MLTQLRQALTSEAAITLGEKNIYTRQVLATVCLQGEIKDAAARLILHFGCDAQRPICIVLYFKQYRHLL